MEKQAHYDLIDQITPILKSHSLTEFRIQVFEIDQNKLSWRDGRLDEVTAKREKILRADVFHNGKYIVQITTDLRPESLERFVQETAAFLDMMPPDPCRSIPDAAVQGISDFPSSASDGTGVLIPEQKRLEIVRDMYDQARAEDASVIEAQSYFFQTQELITFAYSTGFSEQTERASFYQECDVTMLAPDGTRPDGSRELITRHPDKLLSPQATASEAVARCRRQLGQTKAESGIYDIVLDNECIERFINPVITSLTGDALDHHTSLWEGKKGQPVASPLFTIRDDPFIPGGYQNCRCDPEGFPAKRRDLLYQGVLQDWLIDWYHHHKLNLPLTGGFFSNLIIDPGTASEQELTAGMNKGILVHAFNGGNSNPVTGDFSFGISGMLIENGKQSHPVNEMLLSGNYKDCLFRIDATGNNCNQLTSTRFPSLRLRDMHVAGR